MLCLPPKLLFEPTLEGFVFLLTDRSQLSGEALEEAKANADSLGIFERVALNNGQRITAPAILSSALRIRLLSLLARRSLR